MDYLINPFGQHTNFAYDDDGRLHQKQWSNSNFTDYCYDSRSRLSQLAKYHYAAPQPYRNEGYFYNDDSTLDHSIIDTVRTDYTYDHAGQLMSESSPGYSAAYTYDANGNRLTKTLNNVVDNYSYDNADKLTGITGGTNKTFGYDGDGRIHTVGTSAGTT